MEVKYNKIGHNYNLTRKADPYLCSRLKHHLAAVENGLYLDIGCGTGNYTHELQRHQGHFIGIDPSIKMLEKARQKNSAIDWRLATAEQTGLATESIDGIIASLTIHHWDDLRQGCKELYRVLKPGAKIVIFTATPQQMSGYWLNAYFPQMLKDSMIQMPSFKKLKSALALAGFKHFVSEKYFIQEDLQDLFLYSGKHDAQRYLDPSVRKGISSFSALANQQEVSTGLEKLEQDIQSGKIKKVIQSYENEDGDYLFFIAHK